MCGSDSLRFSLHRDEIGAHCFKRIRNSPYSLPLTASRQWWNPSLLESAYNSIIDGRGRASRRAKDKSREVEIDIETERERESELEEIIQFDERGIDELAAEIQNAVDVAAEKSRFAPLKRIA